VILPGGDSPSPSAPRPNDSDGRGRFTKEDGTETLGPFSLIHGPPSVLYDHEGGAAAVTSHGRRVELR
jgi:hypothetical protein